MVSRVVLFAVACSVAGMLSAPAADACTILPTGEKPAKPTLKGVDVAIFGKVIKISEEQRPTSYEAPVLTSYEATVRVWRVYKGRVARTIHIRSTTDGGTCGISFREGEVVALRLNRPSPFYVHMGSQVPLGYLKRATDGRWHRPQQP